MKRLLGISTLCGLLLAATPEPFGGWVTVTLIDVPEHLEVGASTTISFVVRRHGREVDRGLEPALLLERRGLLAKLLKPKRVPAPVNLGSGAYEATFAPDEAGELPITVATGLGKLEIRLLPFRVLPRGAEPVELPELDRGRQLFVAKGCATCHARRDDPVLADLWTTRVGPELTERSLPERYVTSKLRYPSETRNADDEYAFVMPRLELTDDEIESLVRYLSGSPDPER